MGKSGKHGSGTKSASTVKRHSDKTPAALDPQLAALFDLSLPRAPPSAQQQTNELELDDSLKAPPKVKYGEGDEEESADATEASDSDGSVDSGAARGRKRKRKVPEEDIEERYMKKLALEQDDEASEGGADDAEPQQASGSSVEEQDRSSSEGPDEDEEFEIPKHESLNKGPNANEVEKASRTVFLGNVSTAAIKSKTSRRVLMDHLGSFFPKLADAKEQKVDSLRFRSTAFSDASIPKKAAFAKKELMDATTKSTNAYVVYSTSAAAREAVKRLNGTVVLERHLRVDGVAHPSKVDHRRCVFVGNLGFVDDETNIQAAEQEENPRKQKQKTRAPADVEEGLWRQFERAGPVENVRVVRDQATRVGKGFAYVQFKDPNSVEKALLFNDQKFPPMLPRKLRVSRAKRIVKAPPGSKNGISKPNAKGVYRPKPSAQLASLAGRAGNLLGRAGAFNVRQQAKSGDHSVGGKSIKAPEQFVFEGHRATQNRGKDRLKLGKQKKDKRTKRSSSFRTRPDKK